MGYETKLFDVPILIILCGLAIMGVVRHPTYAMYGYYIVGFMRPNEMSRWLFDMRLSMMLVGSTLIGFVIMMGNEGVRKVRGAPVAILALMVLHMFLVGKVHEGNGMLQNSIGHWQRFDYYWKMAMMMWIASKIFSNPAYIQKALTVLAMCGAYLAIWQNHRYFFLYQQPPLAGPGPHLSIWAGLFADRNDFAMMFSMSVPMFWYVGQLQKRLIFKLAWLGMIPVALHAVLLTESRGGLLGISVAMGYITWHSKRRVLMSIAGLIGMIMFVLLFATEKMLKRYGTITNYEQDASALGRKAAWQVGMRMAWANPIWGRGLNNFVAAYYDYQPNYRPKYHVYPNGKVELIMDLEWEIYRARQAHNMWVQTGGELGILGIVLLALYIISVLIMTRFRIASKIKRIGSRGPPDIDIKVMRQMLECPFGPYLITGFFLSMQHFEYIFVLGALATSYNAWLGRYIAALEKGEDLVPSDGPPPQLDESEDAPKAPPRDKRRWRKPQPAPSPGTGATGNGSTGNGSTGNGSTGNGSQAPGVNDDRWSHFPPPRRQENT
ncbi:MAG: O-antigen ligase family protein [Bradymonadia bacterium]